MFTHKKFKKVTFFIIIVALGLSLFSFAACGGASIQEDMPNRYIAMDAVVHDPNFGGFSTPELYVQNLLRITHFDFSVSNRVRVEIGFENVSDRVIERLEFAFFARNAADTEIFCNRLGRTHRVFYFSRALQPGSTTGVAQMNNHWHNPDITYVGLRHIHIVFADGQSVSFCVWMRNILFNEWRFGY